MANVWHRVWGGGSSDGSAKCCHLDVGPTSSRVGARGGATKRLSELRGLTRCAHDVRQIYYDDLWNWSVLAVEGSDGKLSWSPASVKSIAGCDFKGLKFTEICIPGKDVKLLYVHSDGGDPYHGDPYHGAFLP